MRTNELHASAKQVQRSSGRSSVAAAAYRSASLLIDERTGLVHDYTKKSGVEFTRIYVPTEAPDWARDRSTLWNAVERKENRSNSCTASELEVAFPYEFNAMQRREAGDMISSEIMRRYGCAVDIAYHQPNREGDERNFHAHILFTTRSFDDTTKDGWSKNKYRDLSSDKITVDGENTTRGKEEVKSLRAFTAQAMNQIAERDNLDVRTEHLSFAARGIEKEPTQKMGYMATELERRGVKTERGDINRAIIASNDNMGETTAQLTEQRRVLLLEQSRALLALEQEAGNRFSGNTVATLQREQAFPFHQKQIEQAQNELTQAKERLENITLIERMTGKRSAYEAEIQNREVALKEVQRQLEEIRRAETVQQKAQADTDISNAITAQRTAQYKQEQGEAAVLRESLENRNNIERIIGAITGKTKEQKQRLESLQQNIRLYEADRRLEEIRAKQIEDMKRVQESKARDQSRANDNPADRQPQSVEDRKTEFLERMARERAEREQGQKQEIEKVPTVEQVETQRQEEARTFTPEERKQEFLDRMQVETDQKPDKNRDQGRE